MCNRHVEDVYNTLCGQLREEFRVPGVENAFAEGRPCKKWYSDMLNAYTRLRNRLGVVDEDEDVEIIIDSLLSIEQELCCKMYEYGALFHTK